MKINEVEAAVGVTKKNIRFYEAEGLLRPARNAGNGYREYSEADVARLQRIKLLRRLDVPLAEIQQLLDGQCTLADAMQRHAAELETRQQSLCEAAAICRRLGQTPGTLETLDAGAALAELDQREEKGVRFVNVKQVDRKARRYQGAVIGAALFIGLMALLISLFVWAFTEDPAGAPPLPFLVFFIGIPVVCIVCVLVVLAQRFAEIERGEEDAYRNY